MIETRGGTNGFTTGIMEGVENCSVVPNTINEMLCMGHGHVIRVFPTWPWDRGARFHDLRTWGAFLVSSELAGGEVRFLSIRSERGRDCTLANPWPGRTVEVRHQDAPPQRLSGEKIAFATAPGATYEITPVER
jgi:alpha-L-fucosidase 2